MPADKAKPSLATLPGMAKNLQTVARRALTPCAGDEAFRFADGTSARDLADLHHAVGAKTGHLVAHHRADYAAWVERTLGDPALARRIDRLARRPLRDLEAFRGELQAVLTDRLGKLRQRVL
ncbi:MAG: hypothetical protein QOE90_824 [Thermoplasmata archaeon]|jgi:hypothetical protein|nr:hypothetical protein [Thermoplasmata archaeon]